MDLRRLRIGEWVAAVSGVILLAVMPLDWYDVEIPAHQGLNGVPDHIAASAWEVYTAVDVFIALSALTGIAILVVVAAAGSPSPGIAAEALAFLFTAIVGAVVLFRLFDPPAAVDGVGLETARTAAGYLGTAAAVAIPVGLLFAMRDERRSTPDRLTDATGVPVDSAPVPEQLPAPPA